MDHGGNAVEINGRVLITDLDPTNPDDYCFNQEFFSQALAQTDLQSTNPLTFLREAITFANEQLGRHLRDHYLIHPKTMAAMGEAFEDAIAELKYGAVGINIWNAGAFLLAHAAWGAYPGHTVDNIQSGIGTVHNAFLFDKPQKTIVRGPFRSMPRGVGCTAT